MNLKKKVMNTQQYDKLYNENIKILNINNLYLSQWH